MKGKKRLIGLAVVLGAAAIGGTFAYFNQTLTATNMFEMCIRDRYYVRCPAFRRCTVGF